MLRVNKAWFVAAVPLVAAFAARVSGDSMAPKYGEGDIVVIVQEGWSASTATTGTQGAAIDSAIIGIVDYIDLLPKENN